jgi:hypothetical protein
VGGSREERGDKVLDRIFYGSKNKEPLFNEVLKTSLIQKIITTLFLEASIRLLLYLAFEDKNFKLCFRAQR